MSFSVRDGRAVIQLRRSEWQMMKKTSFLFHCVAQWLRPPEIKVTVLILRATCELELCL
jgi:hypothetical protein